MIHDFDLKWLLLRPALTAIGFMLWVLFNFIREIRRKRRKYAGGVRGTHYAATEPAGIPGISPVGGQTAGLFIGWCFTSE